MLEARRSAGGPNEVGSQVASQPLRKTVPDRIVILDPAQPLRFVDDACQALADAVSDTAEGDDVHDELAAVYAEVVGAYGRLLSEELRRLPEISKAWLDIVDHLLVRLQEVRGRELPISVLEVADQLHGRIADVTERLV